MAQVRVTFTEPQCVDMVMVTVEADQLVLLHEGQRVLDVPAEAPRSADQSNGGRLARLRSEYPSHGKPWTEAKTPTLFPQDQWLALDEPAGFSGPARLDRPDGAAARGCGQCRAG